MKKLVGLVCALLIVFTVACAGAETLGGDADGELIYTETVVSDAGISNDDALEAFINQAFGIGSRGGRNMLKAPLRTQGSRLTGVNREAYVQLAAYAAEVAAGNRSSTVFEFSFNGTYTAEDLGLTTLVDAGGKLTAEAYAKLNELYTVDLHLVLNALLVDLPYDLYWYDKTRGTGGRYTDSFSFSVGGEQVTFTRKYTVSMMVAEEYSASGETGTTNFNTSCATSILTAANTAKSIVASNAGKSDYAKMKAYKDAICDLVEYNHDAAENDPPYGNPWQLIWVFDGDPDTKVVCEGYSKAFKYLCDMSDLTDAAALIVTGWMGDDYSSAGGHMWNLVQTGGAQYMVDVTNCDSNSVGYPDYLFMAGYAATTEEDGHFGYIYHGIQNTPVEYFYDDDLYNLYSEEDLIPSENAYTPAPFISATPEQVMEGESFTLRVEVPGQTRIHLGLGAGGGQITDLGEQTGTDGAASFEMTAGEAGEYQYYAGYADGNSIVWTEATVAVTVQRAAQGGDPEILGMSVHPITLGTKTRTDITMPGQVVMYSFKPATEGIYIFCSSNVEDDENYMDTYGYLLDENMQKLAENDDGAGDGHFRIQEKLEAGKQYYFTARAFSREVCSFDVTLEKIEGIYAEAVAENVYARPNAMGTATVSAYSENGGLSYQWYEVKDDGNQIIAGATEASYRFPALTQPRTYLCQVTDASGMTASVPVHAMFDCGVEVISSGGGAVPVGGNTELTAVAVAKWYGQDELTYQWTYSEMKYYEYSEWSTLEGETSNTLQVTNVQKAGAYECAVTDVNGDVYYAWFNVYPDSGLTISRKGEYSRTIHAGESTTLEVEASTDMEPIVYYWYAMDDDYYMDLLDTTAEPRYTVAPMNSQKYECMAVDESGDNRTTSFNVNVESTFEAEPSEGNSEITVAPGESATFTVVTSETTGTPAYQWYRFSEAMEREYPLEGETGASYTTGTQLNDGTYYCVVSDPSGQEKKVEFVLKVDNAFEAEPVGSDSIQLDAGEAGTLTVTASCNAGTIAYRWWREDSEERRIIPGATGASLLITGTGKEEYYYCTVSDPYGHSAEIAFTVSSTHPLEASPVGETAFTVRPGDSVTMKVQASGGSDSLVYQWYKETRYKTEWGSRSIYIPVGNGTDTLTIGAVDGPARYYCEITDEYDNSKSVRFNVSVDNELQAEADGMDTDLTVQLNGSATLKVSANCYTGSLTYQWYKEYNNGQNWVTETLDGETEPELTISAPAKYTEYYCEIRDEYGSNAFVWFYVHIDNGFQAWADGDSSIAVEPGGSATLRTMASCSQGELHYEWHHLVRYTNEDQELEPEDLILDGETANELTVSSITRFEEYYCRVTDDYGNSENVWFTIVIENDFSMSYVGSSYKYTTAGRPVTLAVRASCRNGELTYQWYNSSSDYDEIIPDATTDSLTLENPVMDQTYICRISDMYGTVINGWFSVNIVTGFYAGADGEDAFYVGAGETAEMKVFANSDEGEISYQWYDVNTGEQIAGATDASYTSEPVSAIAGYPWRQYECRVTDGIQTVDVYFSVNQSNREQLSAGTFALRAGQTVYLRNDYVCAGWGYSFTGAASGDESIISVSGRAVTGNSAGTVTVSADYGEWVTVNYTFEVENAQLLKLPEGLTEIEEEAFSGDTSLRFAELGANVSSIGNNAFAGSGLRQIIIRNDGLYPDSVAFGSLKPTIVCGENSSAYYFAVNNGYPVLLLE